MARMRREAASARRATERPQRSIRMTPELQSAVENAYRAFASHRIGRRIDFGSRVGTTEAAHEAMLKVLTQTPLRALPPESVEAYFDYIAAAYYDGGFDDDEFRYFLPRALELIAQRADNTLFMREYLGPILERGNARIAWPAAEVEALDRVLTLIP
jgi:hypothetical protein